jgi:hypothetical protein
MLIDRGYAPVTEVTLANGRRADVLAIGSKGDIVIVETKSGVEDYVVDFKWPDYLDFCDAFYFGVGIDFPQSLLPPNVGVIVADGYGGDIVRPAPSRPLAPARRKAVTLSVARIAALRLFSCQSLSCDTRLSHESPMVAELPPIQGRAG